MTSNAAGLVAFGLSRTQQIARALMDPTPTLNDGGNGAGNGLSIERMFKVVRRNACTREDGSNEHAE